MEYAAADAGGYSYTGHNLLGGYWLNTLSSGVVGATLFGGIRINSDDLINKVTDNGGTVSGGAGNQAGNNTGNAFDARFPTVGGGANNIASGAFSTIAGGNINRASGDSAFTGGGLDNQAIGGYSVVSGGLSNSVASLYGFVGGGHQNIVTGEYGASVGGANNLASGAYSQASGRRAKANHGGTFVWADSMGADFSSTALNQFLIRAGGGVGINASDPAYPLDVAGAIRSRSGGFVFPDGTTQTTASTSGGNSWSLGGNHGTDPSIHFLGTRDDKPLELRVNTKRGFRAEYASAFANGENAFGINLLGGHWSNSIPTGVVGGTIAGGGAHFPDEVLGDFLMPNRVTDSGGTVSGGWFNTAGSADGTTTNAEFATVAGGFANTASSRYATVSGGYTNSASALSATVGGGFLNLASASYATVGGGYQNTTSGFYATMGGGYRNTASGDSATVGGGQHNTATDYAATVAGGSVNHASRHSATVGGGQFNSASGVSATVGGGLWNTASDDDATVGGGYQNTASDFYATVPGGWSNTASGAFSFAAGYRAKARHPGTFVWADNQDAEFASTNGQQFLIRATGGVGINTNFPGASVHVSQGTSGVGLFVGNLAAFGQAAIETNFSRSATHIWCAVNGNRVFSVAGDGAVSALSYSTISDARYKTNVQTFPDALDIILNLRGVTYDWKQADYPGRSFPEGKQVGFIAQEVEKVLPDLVSTDSSGYKSVAYANVVPVLVEAMKTQQKQREADRAEITTIKAENAALKAALETLAKRVEEIAARPQQ